jgi:hypothetical protein
MSEFQLKTAVAVFVFNRPDTTIRVFDEIRRARPPKLLVVADGPRADCAGEAEKCQAVREILDNVNWPCEVLRNYSDFNLGCKIRVSSGLDWVFENAEEAIIMEDDCLPHPTFFRFCAELLDRYRDDKRVMMISGDNFQFGRQRTHYSYYFSRYAHVWGWASWRRAWKHYDVKLNCWPEVKKKFWLKDILGDKPAVQHYWTEIFDKIYEGKIDTWDYQMNFAGWMQNSLNIVPNVNLISNIGFQPDATHTSGNSRVANIATLPMEFPLSHPPQLLRDSVADNHVESLFFEKEPYRVRVFRNIRRWTLTGRK